MWPFSLLRRRAPRRVDADTRGHADTPAVSAAPPLRLGLNVHQLTPDHLAWCAAHGVTQIRHTLYPHARDLADRADAVFAALISQPALELLLVVNGPADRWPALVGYYAGVWPADRVAWQLGNECDSDNPESNAAGVLTPAAYVDAWRAVWERVPATTRLVCCAVGGHDTAAYLDALLHASLIPHAAAVHAYGPPPAQHLAVRVREVDDALARHNVPVRVWCTEFGLAPKDIARAWPQYLPEERPAIVRREWAYAADMAGALVERAYGYCLDADDAYGILGTPTAEWIRATNLGAA